MYSQLRPAFVITIVLTVLTGILYPLAITGISQVLFPHNANGSLIRSGGKIIGSELIAQGFAKPEYFHPRPSAAGTNGYDAAGSSGSNLGPTNPDLAKRLSKDVPAFRKENPTFKGSIPADAVTTSGSGLDPDISPANAAAQSDRVATARGVSVDQIQQFVVSNTDGRQFGLLGEPRVNVMRLNMALDRKFPAKHSWGRMSFRGGLLTRQAPVSNRRAACQAAPPKGFREAMSSVDFTRPDPEELLRRVESEERQTRRGRLKIFLGYAPRVGKSSRMFDEGHRRKSRGQDVVVGGVQVKGSEDVAGQLSAFEVIPPLDIGKESRSLDVQAILRRQPRGCLVDELAYDNPPGAPCAQRWQEVEQLVDAGINVITCINLQHVREQQEAVERITGRRASCSVPEAFIRSADEIVIVDVPPEDLAQDKNRSGGGHHKYDRRQLSQLRELALLLAAEIAEGQLQSYMIAHGIHQSWGTQERIMVCVTPRSNARAMIESGRRNADRFHGQLLAAYVRQPNLSREAEESLEANLEYARKLGAEVHVLEASGDPVSQLVEWAGGQRITQMFVGHTLRPAWAFWSVNPLKKLIEAAEGMDVRIFPHARIA